MDGSNGKIIVLLERIAMGQEKTNTRLDETNIRLDDLTTEVRQTNAEIKQTNARLDNVIGFLGRHFDDHEQRIQALEDRVFKQSG